MIRARQICSAVQRGVHRQLTRARVLILAVPLVRTSRSVATLHRRRIMDEVDAGPAAATTSILSMWRSVRASPPPLPPGAAPLAQDIEDVHAGACQRGEPMYTDPPTGYSVFTRTAHLQRGVCCGSACRHCPFGHFRVKSMYRLARVQHSCWLFPRKLPRSRSSELHVCVFTGADEDCVWLQSATGTAALPALLTLVDARTYTIIGRSPRIHLAAVQDLALAAGIPLRVVMCTLSDASSAHRTQSLTSTHVHEYLAAPLRDAQREWPEHAGVCTISSVFISPDAVPEAALALEHSGTAVAAARSTAAAVDTMAS